MKKRVNLYRTAESASDYDSCRNGHPKVIDWILTKYKVPKEGKIADLGCGTGNETVLIADRIHRKIHCIDKNKPMLDVVKTKLGPECITIRADLSSKSHLNPSAYSYLFSSFTYHQMPDPLAFFEEAFRLLETSGRFVLLDATLEQALDKPLLRFFPELEEIEKQKDRKSRELERAFWQAGFVNVEQHEILFEERVIDSKYLEKVELGELNSSLLDLDKIDFRQGLKKLRAIVKEAPVYPVKRTVITGEKPHDLAEPKELDHVMVKCFPHKHFKKLSGGVINQVYQLYDSSHKSLIIKQGLPNIHNMNVSAELAEFGPWRTREEYKALEFLSKWKGPNGLIIPKVEELISSENLLVIEDISNGMVFPPNHSRAALAKWSVSPASKIGEFLACQHRDFQDKQLFISGSKDSDLDKWQWVFDLRTKFLLDIRDLSECQANLLNERINDLKANHLSITLVNPDTCPKNIILYENGDIGIIDLEFCCGIGDPVFDLGFFAGHLLICGLCCSCDPLETLAVECINTYIREINVSFNNERLRDLEWYMACTILYRSFGPSRITDLNDSERFQALAQRAKKTVLSRGKHPGILFDFKPVMESDYNLKN